MPSPTLVYLLVYKIVSQNVGPHLIPDAFGVKWQLYDSTITATLQPLFNNHPLLMLGGQRAKAYLLLHHHFNSFFNEAILISNCKIMFYFL